MEDLTACTAEVFRLSAAASNRCQSFLAAMPWLPRPFHGIEPHLVATKPSAIDRESNPHLLFAPKIHRNWR